jgi:acetate kinase
VHGGAEFSEATLIDDQVLTAVRRLNPLAPLHNPANVTGIELAVSRFPGVPQVAVFDTAFHRSIPRPAFTYAVPREWQDRYGVRRYGFHGTSHRYVSERAVQMLGGTAGLGLVVLHLGNGASACAVLDGRSIETSMGLTPLEGLVMGTRSGDIDPSIAGHLARNAGMTAGQIDHALNHDSGLLGLAGANDFRTLTEQAAAGDPAARLAIEVTSHRLVKYVGAYAAVLGRLDGVVFTGGIGEHSALLRARVLGGLGVFGMRLDEQANAAAGVTAGGEQRVSHRRSAVAALVIPTREELQIARECLALLASG